MNSPQQDDVEYARRLIRSFLGDSPEEPVLDGRLAVSDIEEDAVEFAEDMSLIEPMNVNVPAVRLEDDEKVPVALKTLFGPDFPRLRPIGSSSYYYSFVDDYVYRTLREVEDGASGYETMPAEEARSTFVRRASNFLATRIAAVREFGRSEQATVWPAMSLLTLPRRRGDTEISTPGCNFSVSTNSTGLRVFWSGAYRVSPKNFSQPTTPVSSVLQSGIYIFGVDSGAYGNQIRWDHNAVVHLPGQPHVHLNF